MDLGGLAEALIGAAAVIFAGYLAIRAQADRDRSNHRREKLQELSDLTFALLEHNANVETAIRAAGKHNVSLTFDELDTKSRVPFDEIGTRIEHLRASDPSRRMNLLAKLWFPDLKSHTQPVRDTMGRTYAIARRAVGHAKSRRWDRFNGTLLELRDADGAVRFYLEELGKALTDVASGRDPEKPRAFESKIFRGEAPVEHASGTRPPAAVESRDRS